MWSFLQNMFSRISGNENGNNSESSEMDITADQNTSSSPPEMELSTENNHSFAIDILDIGDEVHSNPLSDEQFFNQDHTDMDMVTIDVRTVENRTPTISSTSDHLDSLEDNLLIDTDNTNDSIIEINMTDSDGSSELESLSEKSTPTTKNTSSTNDKIVIQTNLTVSDIGHSEIESLTENFISSSTTSDDNVIQTNMIESNTGPPENELYENSLPFIMHLSKTNYDNAMQINMTESDTDQHEMNSSPENSIPTSKLSKTNEINIMTDQNMTDCDVCPPETESLSTNFIPTIRNTSTINDYVVLTNMTDSNTCLLETESLLEKSIPTNKNKSSPNRNVIQTNLTVSENGQLDIESLYEDFMSSKRNLPANITGSKNITGCQTNITGSKNRTPEIGSLLENSIPTTINATTSDDNVIQKNLIDSNTGPSGNKLHEISSPTIILLSTENYGNAIQMNMTGSDTDQPEIKSSSETFIPTTIKLSETNEINSMADSNTCQTKVINSDTSSKEIKSSSESSILTTRNVSTNDNKVIQTNKTDSYTYPPEKESLSKNSVQTTKTASIINNNFVQTILTDFDSNPPEIKTLSENSISTTENLPTTNFEQNNALDHSIIDPLVGNENLINYEEFVVKDNENQVLTLIENEETIVAPPLQNMNYPTPQCKNMSNSGSSFICRVTPRAFVFRVETRTPSQNRKRKLVETVTITEEKVPIEIQNSDTNQSVSITSKRVVGNSASGHMTTDQSTHSANLSAPDLTGTNDVDETSTMPQRNMPRSSETDKISSKTFLNSNSEASSSSNPTREKDTQNQANSQHRSTISNGALPKKRHIAKSTDFTGRNCVYATSLMPPKNVSRSSEMNKNSSKTFANSNTEASSNNNNPRKKGLPNKANYDHGHRATNSNGVLSKKGHSVKSPDFIKNNFRNGVSETSTVPSRNMYISSEMDKTSSKIFANSISEASSRNNSSTKNDILVEANSELKTKASNDVFSKKVHRVEWTKQFPSPIIKITLDEIATNERKSQKKKKTSNSTRRNYSNKYTTSSFSDTPNYSRPSTSSESTNTNDSPENSTIRLTCETCQRTVANKTMLELHRIFHISLDITPSSQQQTPTPQQIKCYECQKSFESISAHNLHILSYQEKYYRCVECLAEFKDRPDHTWSLGPGKYILCPNCRGTGEPSERQISDREARYLNYRSTKHFMCNFADVIHDCEICGKIFYIESLFQRHLFEHIGMVLYCRFCERDFQRVDQFKSHILTHTI